jgi:hypothetical protein
MLGRNTNSSRIIAMSSNQKIILFNGPPSSGKDLAVRYICAAFSSEMLDSAYKHMKMAAPLKKAVHALYGLFHSPEHYDLPAYEKDKDRPHPTMFGLTPRQAYIAMSEEYCKLKHGSDFFGRLFVQRVLSDRANYILCSDGGFVDEWIPVIDHFGAKNVAVMEIHPDGDTSSSFANDSRSYIGDELKDLHPKLIVRKIPNTFGDLDDRIMYQQMCLGAAKQFFGLD